MNGMAKIGGLLALALTLAACGRNEVGASFSHFSVVDNGHVSIHARGADAAILAADGGLSIGGNTVALTPIQQALLKDYYESIVALKDAAIATGKAGIATAGTALATVASGLASGDTDSIGAKVQQKAAKVEAAAAKICVDLATLRLRQDAIAAQLAAFRPYALIDAGEVARCASR